MERVFLLLVVLASSCQGQDFHDPHCEGKQAIVHLFEWKWADIALECERFLQYTGFCGVQVTNCDFLMA